MEFEVMIGKKARLATIFIVGVIIITSFFYAVQFEPWVTGNQVKYYELKTFESYEEFTQYLAAGQTGYGKNYFGLGLFASTVRSEEATDGSGQAVNVPDIINDGSDPDDTVDYSETNIQELGVDEPDIVKTDGTYLYVIAQNKIYIIQGYPDSDAELLAEISVNESTTLLNLFIYQDQLVVFAQTYDYPIYGILEDEGGESIPAPWWDSTPKTFVTIYNVQNRANPISVSELVIPGTFIEARLIEGIVYAITTEYSYYIDEDEPYEPRLLVDEKPQTISLGDIHYVDIAEKSNTMTHIVSVDLINDNTVSSKIYLLGNTQTVYVSQNNIYIAYYSPWGADYQTLEDLIQSVIMPLLPDSLQNEYNLVDSLSLEPYQKETIKEWLLQNYSQQLTERQLNSIAQEIQQQTEQTILHRIHIENGNIEYQAQGTIPGTVRNQFSFSEHKNYLRVSTTLQGWMIRSYINDFEPRNNLYVLDMDLIIAGRIENIAPGEQIYATRFMGDTCYLVTFKQIDPFFVIDLSTPTQPEILGELKIPGFSTYLHPYDSNHIIGIGRDEQNIKITLFDVTDKINPVELDTYEITPDEESWNWMDSTALFDHKAFLFSKDKNLLVLPIGTYGQQEAYVFNISPETGLSLKGTITHEQQSGDHEKEEDMYYIYDNSNSIQRTLYINNILYTISSSMVKLNALDTLNELITLTL